MNTYFIMIFSLLFLIACNSENTIENKVDDKNSSTEKIPNQNPAVIGMTFINDYVAYCNNTKNMELLDWVNKNKLLSSHFKSSIKKIIDDAYAQDPEFGLDADPIFDAQDYPEAGFVLEKYDSSSNTIFAKAKDGSDFKLEIKMRNENDTWLVNACGMVK